MYSRMRLKSAAGSFVLPDGQLSIGANTVFRCFKSDLGFRPIFHHKEERADSHLFITVLAYQLGQLIRRSLKGNSIDFNGSCGESLFLSKDFPCSQRGNPQKYRDKLDCYASPSRPGHSFATQQGVAHMLSNDSTRFRKACIFTTQKTLRENTCTIASGDYSTPVSQRSNF